MHISLDSALGRQRRLNSVGESVLQIAPDAAAAYSLRSLTGGDPDVVRVRRESDNTEKDFSGSQIESGEMARWVNEQPTLPLDLRELDTNTGERDGALIEAAAAYSLRKLKEDFTGDVVEVRRNVDGETEGFTADEVTDGTLESFVKGEEVTYESDFSTGEDGWIGAYPRVAVEGNIDGIGGRDNCLKITSLGGNSLWFGKTGTLQTGARYKVSYEFYTEGNFAINLASNSYASSGVSNGDWVSYEADFISDNHFLQFIRPDNEYPAYIRNVKIISYAENELPLDQATGAAAAYSLRKLSSSFTGDVVQVRRSSDDAVKSFTASEVADGTLESWVNTEYLYPARGISEMSQTYFNVTKTDDRNYRIVSDLANDGLSTTKFIQILAPQDGLVFGKQRVTFDVNVNSGDISNFMLRLSYRDVQTNLQTVAGSNSFEFVITDDGASPDPQIYFAIHEASSFDVSISNLQVYKIENDGFVRTWYDQSGSDNHAVQTTPANQPKIVDGGTLLKDGNNVPQVRFDGAQNLVKTTFTQGTLNKPISGFAVFEKDAVSDSPVVFDSRSAIARFALESVALTTTRLFNGASLDSPTTIGEDKSLVSLRSDGANSYVAVNGGSPYSDPSHTGNHDMIGITIGSRQGDSGWLNGEIQEVIIYDSDQSTKRRAIEENIANHYDISLATFSRDGTVSTWYDQSGNTNDATQTDPTNQPKIVEGGTYLEEVDFDGTQYFETIPSGEVLSDIADTFTVWLGKRKGSGFVSQASSYYDNQSILELRYWVCTIGEEANSLRVGAILNVDTLISLSGVNGVYDGFKNGANVNDTETTASTTAGDFTLGATRLGYQPLVGTIKEFIIYNSDQSDNRTAIEANIGETYGITDIPAANDTVNGFVQTWYDQSGNSNDAVQSAAANQPKIVDGGTLNSDGIYFDGTDDELNSQSIDFGDNPNTIFTLVKSNDLASAPFFISLGGIRNLMWHNAAATRLMYAGANLTGGTMSSNQELWSGFFDNPNDTGTLHVNGTQDASGNIGTNVVGTTTVRIGADNGSSPLNGWFKEIIIYNSDQSSNRPAIETNIANQYGITLS